MSGNNNIGVNLVGAGPNANNMSMDEGTGMIL